MAAHGKKRIATSKAAAGSGTARVVRTPPQPETVEERLVAKAEAADRRDRSGERSLGQMSREERHKLLFGK